MGLTFQSAAQAARSRHDADIVDALNRSQAVIEFDPQGKIIAANQNFLAAMNYSLDEVLGQHHRIFVPPEQSASSDYAEFWAKLRQGQFQAATFKRLGKGGKEVWIEATYNPLVAADGKVYRVIKFASDVTRQQQLAADARGQLAAIARSQAVIEFDLTGRILSANQNFCDAIGYQSAEIVGQHHRMFVTAQEAASPAYAQFWQRLGQGEFYSGEFMRLGKGGRQVWIQASYNAIFNADGQPYKVVKYATDITARKEAVNQLGDALGLLAQGDLNCQVNQTFPGELEAVRQAFNQTLERITGIVRDLRSGTSALRHTTGEILTGANELSMRTERQSDAIAATVAAVELLNQTVGENAQRTDTARANTRKVSDEASQTGTVMSQANQAMQEVTAHANRISTVIGMIDDIAFQTNLLALNASVEAARAGDAGKGFAVVAVEVRRLAQSAASASSDVKALIEQSSAAVAKGTQLVASAGASLDVMVGQVGDNANLMEDIARATGEQTVAIGKVSNAMRQMDQMTRENGQLVQQTHAAIQQTEDQSERVNGLVEMFNLGARETRSRPAQPSRRSA